MASSSNEVLSSKESTKLKGCMLKWKPRKVCAVRTFPARCGRNVVFKSGETSATENVGAIRNLELRNAVMAGCDGISETELMDSGAVKITNVGVDSESHESETRHVGESKTDLATVEELTEFAYCVEKSVMETGPVEMPLQDKVDGQRDEAITVNQAESLNVMVGQVAMEVDILSDDVDEPAIEAKVGGVNLTNVVSSDSSEGSTEVDEGDSMLKELNRMDGLGHNSQKKEVMSVLGGASADNTLLPGPSQLLTSAQEYNRPGYSNSMSDKIKFHHREVSVVHDFHPTRMNVSFPKEDNELDRKKYFDVERETTTPYRSEAVVDKARLRDNNLTAGKESRREVVHGPRAAPYCPWRNVEASVDSVWKTKQPERKYVPVSNSSPEQRSERRSKRRACHDWLDIEGSSGSGSSTFSKNKDNVAFTEQPACVTPISMFNPDIEHVSRKSCNLKSSRSALSSAYEKDDDLMPGTITLKNTGLASSNSTGATSRVEMQNIHFWQKKGKAVARKTICSEKNSGNNEKAADFPADSLFSGKTKEFDVRLPPLGPKYRNCGDARSRVRDTLMYFHCICRKLLQKEEGMECRSKNSGKQLTRPDLAASNLIKHEGKDVNTEKQILGEVPGVAVGDEFQYRAELAVVGMHRHLQNGIDSMEHEGVPVAISIVASGSYNDDTEDADVLIYSGQGGNIVGKNKNYEDQKLERGNLALSNSKKKGTPVRVVRGWRETVKGTDPFDSKSKLVSTYYYDGLYTVKRYWTETGSHGKLVYKFELTRNHGQPKLAWKELKKACKSKVREGVSVADISHGKERFPVCAVNVLDEEKPPKFTYISKMMYPDWYRPSPPMGCDCVGRCNDPKKCRCAIRNGGNVPYNRNGAIVEVKPTVYECGPHCKCLPTCYNRVTQRGIRLRLEIFKTNRRGWGLRASTSVPSGTFICEYAGELLEDKEAEKRIGDDEYLFDIGQNCVDSSMNYKDSEIAEEDRYTVDACHYGNVGRFINHSCSPNLYAQYVMYDHDDDKMPHVMLFAAENIPPFKELTYHYNYKVNQVHDSNGNIKIKKCFCGSADCRGRMY